MALPLLTILVMFLAVAGLGAGMLVAGRPLRGGCSGSMSGDACALCGAICERRLRALLDAPSERAP